LSRAAKRLEERGRAVRGRGFWLGAMDLTKRGAKIAEGIDLDSELPLQTGIGQLSPNILHHDWGFRILLRERPLSALLWAWGLDWGPTPKPPMALCIEYTGVTTANTSALLRTPVDPDERSALAKAMELLRGELQDGSVMAPKLEHGWKDGLRLITKYYIAIQGGAVLRGTETLVC
jgi:hypothetical protein